MSIPNRLFKGWCSNEGNPRSHILHYHVTTVRLINDYNGGSVLDEVSSLEEYFNIDGISTDEPYYLVTATFKINIPRGPIKVLETPDLKIAIFVVESLSGNKVIENEI